MGVLAVAGAGQAIGKALGAIGLGKGPPWAAAHRRAREAVAKGDLNYLFLTLRPRGLGGTKFPKVRAFVKLKLRQLGVPEETIEGVNSGALAVSSARIPTWPPSGGIAPDADSSDGEEMPSAGATAPAASRPKRAAKKPCKYGARGPDGLCPKKPTAISAPFAAAGGTRKGKPCKYGPRDPDGYCPKKPTALASGKLTKAQQKLVRRAETAAGRVLVMGVKGAGQAIKAGLGAAGVTAGTAAATAAAVIAAAAVGWLIGQAINDRGESKALRIENANRDRRQAVAAMREKLGRQPTLMEQAEVTAGWRHRLRLIETGIG